MLTSTNIPSRRLAELSILVCTSRSCEGFNCHLELGLNLTNHAGTLARRFASDRDLLSAPHRWRLLGLQYKGFRQELELGTLRRTPAAAVPRACAPS